MQDNTDQERVPTKTPWLSKKTNYVLGALVVLAILLFLHTAAYVPEHERSFLKGVEKGFADGRQELKIADVTTFDWDKVCTIMTGKSQLSQARFEDNTKADWSAFYDSLPPRFDYLHEDLLPLRPVLGLAFIKNTRVVSVYSFRSPIIHLGGTILEIYEPVEVYDKKDAEKICRSRHTANLVRRHSTDGSWEALSIEDK